MKIYPMKQKGLKQTALQEEGHKVTIVSVDSLAPGLYKEVVVKLVDGRHTLHIPNEMDAPRFRFWKKSNAGIFSRDLLRFSRDKNSGEWLKIQGKKYTSIIRLIDKTELLDFDALKLLHGKIKDTYYMHLKTVLSKQNINWSTGYISQSENELNDFDQTQLELAEMENSETNDNPKKTVPRPGSLFK